MYLEEVYKDVPQTLQVISPTLLEAEVGICAGVAGSTRQVLVQGCIKFPGTWYSFPPLLFYILIFFPKMSFPSSTLDIFPTALIW